MGFLDSLFGLAYISHEAKKEAEERLNNPTQEELLKDIRDLLKAQQIKDAEINND